MTPVSGRRSQAILLVLALLTGVFATLPARAQSQEVAPGDGQSPPEPEQDTVQAGVARVEATWHLGASGGQFSDDGPPFDEQTVDPHMHSTKKKPAYGQGSRVDVRALVVQGSNGERVAIVSHDLYLPNDFLTRRIATLVERATGIPASNVMVTASHNHNSAFYSTPSWGTWIFQDVFDLRFYEYMAEKGALAVEKAVKGMVPVRVGGGTSEFNEITSHTYGPKVADDGTPAGQPYDHTTGELTVVSFDDISADTPKPLATWVVFGVHPEWTWGYDLLNGDISHATMRITDREIGGMTVWSGREIGASGPHKDTRAHGWEERREFQDNGFAEMDRAARMLADAIEDTRSDVAAGDASELKHFAPLDSTFAVDAASQRFAPPSTRPHPGVSNCNTASLFHGDPRIPILGLPDCARAEDPPGEPTGALGPLDDVADAVGENVIKPATDAYSEHTSPMYDQLKQAGVPIPESYSGTKLTGVEETAAVHLMAIKLGSIGITVCPCEQFTDTALNIQSRIDDDADNLYVGFSWTDRKTPGGRDWCVQNADETWSCANPQNPSQDLAPISDIVYRRFVAQIKNDAKGWEIDDLDDPESDVRTLGAEAEPYEPEKIKGNFTHEEFPDHGYALPISVGMGNDYWGYVPEYREMRSHDHYRKALNGLGPHGADFLATRLARLAVSMNDGPGVPLRALDVAYQAESARAQVLADGLGELADAYEKAYRPTLPKDGGEPRILTAPDRVERFDAFNVTWVGGSTYADIPTVTIERKDAQGRWETYGDTAGDVQLMVDFPNPDQIPGWRAGAHEWTWTATFEAFGSDVELPDAQGVRRRSTPAGEYRAVIEGQRRTGEPKAPESCDAMTKERCVIDSLVDYELVKEFTVAPWDGIVARDVQISNEDVSFEISSEPERICGNKQGDAEPGEAGPIDLPDSYSSSFPYIRCQWRNFGPAEDRQSYCSFCTFRPWADTSRIAEATVTIERVDGTVEEVAATRGEDGRWHAPVEVYEGDKAYVAQGDVVDEYDNLNGARSNEQTGTRPRPTPTESEPDEPTPTVMAYEGDTSAQYSDETTLKARLTDTTGNALAGRDLVFELVGAASSRTFTAATDENGLAQVTPTISEQPGAHQLTVRYAGNDEYLGSADTTLFVVDKEDTTTELTASGNGRDSALHARLFDSDAADSGIAGATLHFFANGEAIGSTTTDAGGRASLALPPRYRGGKHSFEARFEGDDFYRPSTGRTGR